MSKQALKRVRRALGMPVNRNPLDAYAWPGGYPIYYLCADGGILCPDCANKEIDLIAVAKRDCDKQWQLEGYGIHWEGEPLPCDHCGKEIESAYGSPDDDN